jgi:hypothetical protein
MVKVELIIVEHDGRVRHDLWQDETLIREDAVVTNDGVAFRVHRVIESPALGFDAIALLVEADDAPQLYAADDYKARRH